MADASAIHESSRKKIKHRTSRQDKARKACQLVSLMLALSEFLRGKVQTDLTRRRSSASVVPYNSDKRKDAALATALAASHESVRTTATCQDKRLHFPRRTA